MIEDVVLGFEQPADPISMNQGDTWKIRAAAAAWRNRAYYAWIEQHPGVGPSGRAFGGRARVLVGLSFPQHRRRDPINFTKTVKHIVDGMVMAGAWPDDTLEFVEQNVPVLLINNSGICIVRVMEWKTPFHQALENEMEGLHL